MTARHRTSTFDLVMRGTSRGTWWALLVGGVGGAIVATLVLIFTTGGGGDVRAASAHRPAAVSSSAGVDRPSVVFIGDSWTEGSGAQALRGFAVRTAEQLHWSYLVLGVGGSGYDVA